MEQYNEYIVWDAYDEKEIVSLWLAWSSIIRKNFSKQFSIGLSYNNYQRDILKIGNDIASYVSSELLSKGFQNKVVHEDSCLKIWLVYNSAQELFGCSNIIISILQQKLQKQSLFSTVKLVEAVLFKNIEYHPILSNGLESMSLDGGYFSYSWFSVENIQKDFPKPVVLASTEPKWIDKNEGAKLMNQCRMSIAPLGLVKSLYDSVEYDSLDEQGKDILMHHINEMVDTAIKNEDNSFSKLEEYTVNNGKLSKELINELSNICKYFINLFAKLRNHDNSWLQYKDFIDAIKYVAERTTEIQIEMVKSKF